MFLEKWVIFNCIPTADPQPLSRIQPQNFIDKILKLIADIFIVPYFSLFRIPDNTLKFLFIGDIIKMKRQKKISQLICHDPKRPKIDISLATPAHNHFGCKIHPSSSFKSHSLIFPDSFRNTKIC